MNYCKMDWSNRTTQLTNMIWWKPMDRRSFPLHCHVFMSSMIEHFVNSNNRIGKWSLVLDSMRYDLRRQSNKTHAVNLDVIGYRFKCNICKMCVIYWLQLHAFDELHWEHYVVDVSNHYHVQLKKRFIMLIDWLIGVPFVWWVHHLRMRIAHYLWYLALEKWWNRLKIAHTVNRRSISTAEAIMPAKILSNLSISFHTACLLHQSIDWAKQKLPALLESRDSIYILHWTF